MLTGPFSDSATERRRVAELRGAPPRETGPRPPPPAGSRLSRGVRTGLDVAGTAVVFSFIDFHWPVVLAFAGVLVVWTVLFGRDRPLLGTRRWYLGLSHTWQAVVDAVPQAVALGVVARLWQPRRVAGSWWPSRVLLLAVLAFLVISVAVSLRHARRRP